MTILSTEHTLDELTRRNCLNEDQSTCDGCVSANGVIDDLIEYIRALEARVRQLERQYEANP